MLDAAAPQLLAHDARERVVRRFGQVRHAQGRRIEPVARAHAGNDRDGQLPRAEHERELRADGVDGVDDVIAVLQWELFHVLRRDEAAEAAELDRGVDIPGPLLGGLGLGQAERGMQREDLPVEVREGDRIAVDEHEGADAASYQRLEDVAAHPAQADHGHAGARELFHILLSEKHPRSGKLIRHVRPSDLSRSL